MHQERALAGKNEFAPFGEKESKAFEKNRYS